MKSVRWTVPPTVVGGTGGSGTRVATHILSAGGVFMGAHLNLSGDSLEMADFAETWGKRYLQAEQAGTATPDEEMRAALRERTAAHLDGWAPDAPWGWKDPPSYLLLPWLDSAIADLRFVHFVRDGRRMAFSHNQRQPSHYGEVAFSEQQLERWPGYVLALQFWSWANMRAADYGEEHMQGRYLRVRFEDVCAEPRRLCRQLIDFARADERASDAQIAAAARHIAAPKPPKLNRKRLAEVRALEVPGLARFGYA